MRISLKKTLRQIRRYIMTVARAVANKPGDGPIIDPPTGYSDAPIKMCWDLFEKEQILAAETSPAGQPARVLEVGKIGEFDLIIQVKVLTSLEQLEYCKERNGVQHEFLRAKVRQRNNACYWVLIQRGTNFAALVPSPSPDATNSSNASLPSVAHPSDPNHQPESQPASAPVEHRDEMPDIVAANSRPSNASLPRSKKSSARTDRTRLSRGAAALKRKTSSCVSSIKNGSAKTARKIWVGSSGGAVQATDHFYRDKNEDDVVISARKKQVAEVLKTLYFRNADTAPTIADLVMAAKTVTDEFPDYSMVTMCYFYATFVFELMNRSALFTPKEIVPGENSNRCGKFYWIRKTKLQFLNFFKKTESEDILILVIDDDLRFNTQLARRVEEYVGGQISDPTPFVSPNVLATVAPPIVVEFQKLAFAFEALRNENRLAVTQRVVRDAENTRNKTLVVQQAAVVVQQGAALAEKDADLAKANATIAALQAAQSGSSTGISQITTSKSAAGLSTENSVAI